MSPNFYMHQYRIWLQNYIQLSSTVCVHESVCVHLIFKRYLLPLYLHVQNNNNNTEFTGACRELNLMRRVERVTCLFCTHCFNGTHFPPELP